MNKDIQRLENKIDDLTNKINMIYTPIWLDRPYPHLNCKLDVDVKLISQTPPTTATEACIMQQQETRIKHLVYTHIKDLQRDINILLNP